MQQTSSQAVIDKLTVRILKIFNLQRKKFFIHLFIFVCYSFIAAVKYYRWWGKREFNQTWTYCMPVGKTLLIAYLFQQTSSKKKFWKIFKDLYFNKHSFVLYQVLWVYLHKSLSLNLAILSKIFVKYILIDISVNNNHIETEFLNATMNEYHPL